MRGVKRDIASGTLLIVGTLAGVVVMALHPVAHDLMNPERGPQLARLNVMVHSLGLDAAPMIFLGLLGLWRRLRPSDLGTAALVLYGWGLVAVMSAAVASGFVAPKVIESEELLRYTGLWNQGFAKVNVVATSTGILLFGATILKTNRLSRAAGVFGLVVSALILVLFFVGHIRLDVHGFGVITFAQSAWLLWVGILLCREDPVAGRSGA
jgi:hypothetical protein